MNSIDVKRSLGASLLLCMNRALSISRDEFIRAFRLCKPLVPWSETIAIGNSGGPDSTSLLFLIHRYLSENSHVPNLPRRVISLHVNHGLQAASEDMAQRCAESARSIGVEHHALKVPWSKDNFPDFPSKGSIEEGARDARFRTLFNGMTSTNTTVLALGHHADDQVETSLMRIMKGSTADGAAGMKPCRRWGMDFAYPGTDGPTNFEGMRRWIIRPLLGFPKDRLLATCEENDLSYVTDETNFQPEITLRNALRHWLANDGRQSESDKHLLNVSILQKKLEDLGINIDLSAGARPIYPTVKALTLQANDIDDEVDHILSRNSLRPPVGTYLIPYQTLATIENPKIQRAVVLRIIRYVSFHPWGSLAAQAKRRSSSLSQITDKLWSGDATIRPFYAGGGVAWNPVSIQGDRFRFVDNDFQNKESFAWLASRQIPPRKTLEPGHNQGLSLLRVNLTHTILSKLASGNTSPFEILYDNRFLVTIYLAALPLKIKESLEDGSEIWILPQTKWYSPKVVQKNPTKFRARDCSQSLLETVQIDRSSSSGTSTQLLKPEMFLPSPKLNKTDLAKSQGQEVVLHSAVTWPKSLVLFPNLNERDVEQWKQINWRPFDASIVAPWIEVNFMRPLTAM